ncbi:MAG: hypothetical protein HY211_03325 [Candidatus Omnitrophica bacterium]|nr:hypothetical protein [Candidatus Omnitrophota bacterium]
MEFQNLEQLKKVGEILAESDFDRANCCWEPGPVFILETARPPADSLKGAGLFRKTRQDWVPCRLTISHVKGISIWEEYDAKPPLGGLLGVEPSGTDFEIHLRSAHGLRVDLLVGRLEGALEDQ